MQFLILARDATDAEAPARRLAAREDHLAMVEEYKRRGHMIAGAATLDESGQMNGSAVMVDFPDREALEEWLNEDPYVIGNVWQEIQVIPVRLAPPFQHLLK